MLVVMGAAAPLAAFNGHVVHESPLKLNIGEVADVRAFDTPYDVPVTVENTGKAPLAVRLTLTGLVDEWRAVGDTAATVEVAPGKAAGATFQIAAGAGAVSALYPVWVEATVGEGAGATRVRAVRIVETRFPEAARAPKGATWTPVNVPSHGTLPLLGLRNHRVTWQYTGKDPVTKPVGWQGSDETSRASYSRRRVDRGGVRNALEMHPPYIGGTGGVFAEYRLRLPETTPIRLLFANAIRDHHPPEPASDGVTFRVWVAEEKVFERHRADKVWVEGEADLSPYAGREVLLRLESHPGPRNNTVCDSSYWAEPTVVAGSAPAKPSETVRATRREAARAAVLKPGDAAAGAVVFPLDGESAAAVLPGPSGLADAAIAFAAGDRVVVFDGMVIEVEGAAVGAWPPQVVVRQIQTRRDARTGRLRLVHQCDLRGESFNLVAEAWAEGPGLRVRITCPRLLTDLASGPADRLAPVVTYGHGYRVVEPEAFRAHAGGHNLSTSHVGFDFADGPSLLVAADHGPDYLDVDPDRRRYALHAHEDTTFTFVPSGRGALDAAVRYRPLCTLRPAPGVAKKAGRFVFDIWGGRYADNVRDVRQAFAYGLTDSLYLLHVWQRWGYDYRLPDIWPPNPQFGTLEEVQKLGRVCRERSVPWGLHDNYIDFYPDAAGYTYDHIVFTESGRPQKAWINEGRDAQSYRWRPDAFRPFLERNLALIKPALAPTASFVDVFSSMGGWDFWDGRGTFHPKSETLRHWGEAFDTIRKTLGGAITVSEAGGDHLIGHLDGADCQHLQLTDEHRFHCIRLRCKAWQRVPWFDAVNHRRFSLHGVGYSGRYQGQRSRRQHGIESDDYLTSEILFGHALMMDRGGMVRGAVRKYWLAQGLIRRLADDAIARVDFAAGDACRQTVTWESGAVVHVNRGETDWAVAGHTLPPFGYYARSGKVASCIERRGGLIVEWSRGPGRWYVNGRGSDPEPLLRIRPSAGDLAYLGGRTFKLPIHWDAEAPAPNDLHTFVHFVMPPRSRLGQHHFYTGSNPKPPTSRWTGRVTTGTDRVNTVPEDCPPGRYDVLVGLWSTKDRQRRRLLGEEADQMRFRVGTIVVEGKGGKVTAIRLEKPAGGPSVSVQRTNPDRVAVDFGPIVTAGAVRCQMPEPLVLVLTPLPEEQPVQLAVRLAVLLPEAVGVREVVAVDSGGNPLRPVPFKMADGQLTFETRSGEFAYRVTATRPAAQEAAP